MDRDETEVSFAVVVPMYNEANGAEAFILKTAPLLEATPYRNALVIVDDGSTDGTREILDRLAGDVPGLVVLRHEKNAGYGAGLVTGANYAVAQSYDYVLFMDSDLTNPPDHIGRFVAFMRGGFDLIKGCRYCPGGDVVGVPRKAYLISRIGNLIARQLFGLGVSDSTNGFRAIRARHFVEMPLRERGFAIIMEELMWARRRNLSVANVPTTLYSRSAEQRPTLFNYSFRQAFRYLKYAIRARFASDQ